MSGQQEEEAFKSEPAAPVKKDEWKPADKKDDWAPKPLDKKDNWTPKPSAQEKTDEWKP